MHFSIDYGSCKWHDAKSLVHRFMRREVSATKPSSLVSGSIAKKYKQFLLFEELKAQADLILLEAAILSSGRLRGVLVRWESLLALYPGHSQSSAKDLSCWVATLPISSVSNKG